MKLPFGKYKDQPVHKLSTAYLASLIADDEIRAAHWSLVVEVVRELARRLNNSDRVLAELDM